MGVIIRFTGRVTWEGMSNGLPPFIYAYSYVNEPTPELIEQTAENAYSRMVASQTMVIHRDQSTPVNPKLGPHGQRSVPFHNLSCIDVDVLPMTGELSTPDENGTELLSNGEEPVKQ